MKCEIILHSEKAKKLYEFAKTLPIIDYHNHLSVKDLSQNRRFTEICDLWIAPDPYKHRAMRMMGVPEEKITGNAPVKEKFKAWCGVFPYLIGNPLYIWSAMELEMFFGISDVPSADNAELLYEKLNHFLQNNAVTPDGFMKKTGVELLCPCCSVIDDCSFFVKSEHAVPSLRGDDMTSPTVDFTEKLGKACSRTIKDLDGYKQAIIQRLDEMKAVGLKFADHALDDGFTYYADDGKNGKRFSALCANETLSEADKQRLFSHMLTFLASAYAKRGMVLELHIGAARHTSTRLRTLAGTAGGYAAVGNSVKISSLTAFLDTVEKAEYGLPKMILFTLNPSDNALLSVLSGSYAKDGVRGLITQGPAWWWCDHKQGITDMLENAAAFGLLSNFVGMTTDSRSFLSLARHDYFRRILCNFVADKAEAGEFPDDVGSLSRLVGDLCYGNVKSLLCEKGGCIF